MVFFPVSQVCEFSFSGQSCVFLLFFRLASRICESVLSRLIMHFALVAIHLVTVFSYGPFGGVQWNSL